MATLKYKEASPYAKQRPQPPNEDYLYKMHEEDLALKCDFASDSLLNVALFGVGRAGTIHLRNVLQNPRCRLVYVVDDMECKWSKIRKHFQLDDTVTFLSSKQAGQVYNDAKIDAVIVASPTYTHEEIVINSLNAKKAVFCEKPVAETRSNTEKCFEVAKKVGKPLFTAFNRRFDPSYVAVRDRVRNGDVGHVHTVKIVSRDSPLPTIDYLKVSGGVFHDCMVHDIDMMIWILGEYPSMVSGRSANFAEIKAIDDFDTVAATMKFPSGTLGLINLSRNACYGYDMRLEAFGPKGMVRAENEQPIHCVETQYGYNGPNAAPIWYSFASRFKNAYMQELNHFFDIALGKCESSVKPKGVLAVSKIAAACEESARTNKMVELHWTADELSEIY